MNDWKETVKHGAASERHEADIIRDVRTAIEESRQEERERIATWLLTISPFYGKIGRDDVERTVEAIALDIRDNDLRVEDY